MRFLIILLILAGAGYWWHYRHERFKEFDGLQTSLQSTERLIAERQKDVDRVQKTLEPLRKGHQETQGPGNSEEQLEQEIDALKEALKASAAQLDTSEAEFLAAVNAVRDRARKQTFPELKLPSGEVLKDCTITKFGEGYLSISHREGINRIQGEDLPEGWVAKYAVDYVSRESQAEKEALTARVAEATIPPEELKNAELGELEARIAELDTKLLALSAEMREATRKADELVRNAYRIALDKGQKGDATAAKRTAMFSQSKAMEGAREEVRKKYIVLRNQKLALERQRLELRRKRVPSPSPAP